MVVVLVLEQDTVEVLVLDMELVLVVAQHMSKNIYFFLLEIIKINNEKINYTCTHEVV